MTPSKTQYTRKVLAGLNISGADRLYQQLDCELGMILTFHRVDPAPVPDFAPNAHLSIRPDFLIEVIKFLKQRRIELISLDDAYERMQTPVHGSRFAVLTFDDGYLDTLEQAVPILRDHQVPYLVYLAPGLIEGTADLWWEAIGKLVETSHKIHIPAFEDNTEGLSIAAATNAEKKTAFAWLVAHLTTTVPELSQKQLVRKLCQTHNVDVDDLQKNQMMDWQQVSSLMADPLCTIGAHTLNHQALARLSEAQATSEVMEGALTLEKHLGTRPQHFAYPYGYRSAAADRDFRLVKKLGFKTAVTTRGGMIFPDHKNHLTGLPRISVNGLFQKMRYFAPLTSGLPTRLSTGLKRLDVA